ncbi:MAG: hypothetical protein FWE02_06060 [Defluviitaleaceae bacterium]|nr:hypothetical protein [Defluviitaleaceae bacterium]
MIADRPKAQFKEEEIIVPMKPVALGKTSEIKTNRLENNSIKSIGSLSKPPFLDFFLFDFLFEFFIKSIIHYFQ